MRPVNKSIKYNSVGKPLEIDPYRDSKPGLIEELGEFCSYCEKRVNRSSLHVEHIYGQKVKNSNGELIYEKYKFRWDNFLLACSNCNSIKNNKDVAITNPYLPHTHNLLHFIEIGEGAVIKLKSELTEENSRGTKNYINLVGLDRKPGDRNYSYSDDRWEQRLKTLNLAQRYYKKYTSSPKETSIETIVDLAKSNGFFSVWYYQFLNQKDVLEALIHGFPSDVGRIDPFPGTDSECFSKKSFISLERKISCPLSP